METTTTTAVQATPAMQAENMALPVEVTVRPIAPRGKLIAFATVTYKLPGGELTVPDCPVYNGDKGFSLGNPSRQDASSRSGWRDTSRLTGDVIKNTVNVAARAAYVAEVERLQARAAAALVKPEKPRIREQLEQAGQEAARHNADIAAPDMGKDKAARNER